MIVLLPFSRKECDKTGRNTLRFYHVYEEEEIIEECQEAGGQIEAVYNDCNNWAVIMTIPAR